MDQRGQRHNTTQFRGQEDRGRDHFENPDRIDRVPDSRNPREELGLYRRQQRNPRADQDEFYGRPTNVSSRETFRNQRSQHDDGSERMGNREYDLHPHAERMAPSQFRQMQSLAIEEDTGEGEEELTGKERMKQFRERPIPLWQKIRSEEWKDIKTDIQDEIDATDRITNSTRGLWESISGTYNNTKDFISKFALWNSQLKMVEGTFGSGVYNFFKFLKWAMGLNLLMSLLTVLLISVPEHFNDEFEPICNVSDWKNLTLFPVLDADNCCSALYNQNQEMKREPLTVSFGSFVEFITDIGYILINLLYGDGWMESTYLYYGKYNYDNAGSYQMAVAYFFVIFCCFAISLIRLVMHTAKYFKQGFKFNELNSSQYFDLVFCSWDHSINTEKSVRLAKLAFANEIKTALCTDELQKKEGERKALEKFVLYLKRTLIWVFVAGVIGGFGYGVYLLYELGLENVSNDDCGSFDSLNVDSAIVYVECLLKTYATTIAITGGNLLLPFLFSYLTHFEEYDPKTQLMIDLVRNIVIRLSGLMVIIGGHINSNKCAYYETDDHQQACDNSNFLNVSSCARRICWETAVGVEFYRLTVLDLLTQILVIIGLDVWRVKCFDKLEFNIPKHVLDIVYSQTICWMGLFFAPLLSLITLIKLFSLFYIRLSYLKNWCKPSKTFYEASRTSSLLNIFLLVSFVFSFIPIAYILGEMAPSNACGPFRGPEIGNYNEHDYYTGVVWNLVDNWSDESGKQFFLFISQTSVLMVASAGILMATYFTYLNYDANREYNNRIEAQLKEINKEIKELTHEKNKIQDEARRQVARTGMVG